MRSRRIRTVLKKLHCITCGEPAVIRRRRDRDKPKGHIKHMWCYRCKARTAHVEEGRL